jgi:hypothetical protein
MVCYLAIGFSLSHDRTGQVLGDNVVGLVQDSAGNPVSDVRVRVYASRPIDSSPTVVTILHPDCQLSSNSDGQGRFEIKGISDGHEVMLVAWKTGHLIGRTGYVSSSTENIAVAIRSAAETKLSGKISGKIFDANGLPIANAVVGYDDAYAAAKPIAVMTDSTGQFSLPSEENSYPVSLTAIIPKIGLRDLRLHSRAERTPQTSWTILPSVTATGRIIDENGAVPKYIVCVSSASTYGPRILLTAATDSKGQFTISGVPEGQDGLGRNLEYCIFGDISQADPRGHLATKRFDAGNNGEVLDFGDMRLEPVTNLILKLELNGAKLEDKRANVTMSLRQQCKAMSVPINEDGLAQLKNLPCEPLLFRLSGVSPFRYSDSNKYQPDYSESAFYFNPHSQTELVVQMEKVR